MPRILVVGINYAPEAIGTGKYTGEMCAWLAARGHAVRVITAPPYYPGWKVPPGHSRRWFRREVLDGVDVIRCPLWVPAHPGGIKRLLHLASFAATSALALLSSLAWRPQRVLVIAPTLACAPASWLTARLARVPCWLHLQDFELDAMLDMGIVRAGPLKRSALALEGWLLRRFDTVSTISMHMLQRLQAKGVDAGKCVLFPNWADIEAIRPLDAPSPYRAELGIDDDAVVALYSGNMGLKQGLELLGQAANALPGIQFVFGGDGPARPALEAACAGLRNVRFLPLQPAERLNEWLGLADIHLLPQRADVADLVMPSKLTGMLASGRPVVATAMPGTGMHAVVRECGLVAPCGDTGAFVTSMDRLCCDRELRAVLGNRARAIAVSSLGKHGVLAGFEAELTGEEPWREQHG